MKIGDLVRIKGSPTRRIFEIIAIESAKAQVEYNGRSCWVYLDELILVRRG